MDRAEVVSPARSRTMLLEGVWLDAAADVTRLQAGLDLSRAGSAAPGTAARYREPDSGGSLRDVWAEVRGRGT